MKREKSAVTPKNPKGFVRGKNNEAVVVSPQQGNKITPSDKILKKVLTTLQ